MTDLPLPPSPFQITPLDSTGLRRLMLAKDLYLHGVGHSNLPGSLNKIISVHNIHNAIEIVVSAILLSYGIRPEKQLNIDFESMLNEIDQHPLFKSANQRLPYRRDVRTLNTQRNLAQHHAAEPPDSVLKDFIVTGRKFLETTCREYFGKEFDSLSRLSLFGNPQLRQIVELAISCAQQNTTRSIALSRVAWEWVIQGLSEYLHPLREADWARILSSPGSSIMQGFGQGTDELRSSIQSLAKGLQKLDLRSALLNMGVNYLSLRRFEQTPIWVVQTYKGVWRAQFGEGIEQVTPDDCRWMSDFLADTVLNLEAVGVQFATPKPDDPSFHHALKLLDKSEESGSLEKITGL